MNLFRAHYIDGALVLDGKRPVPLAVADLPGLASGDPVLIGARPHELSLAEAGAGRLPIRVSFTEHLGRSNFVVCTPDGGADCLEEANAVQVETEPGTVIPEGREAFLAFDVAALKLFDAGGRAIHCRPHQTAPSLSPIRQPLRSTA